MSGYFGIGVINPKTETNIGTLWRSAYQFGASFIFVIGVRYKKHPGDTIKAYTKIPLFQYDCYASFLNSRIYDCEIICVEICDQSQNIRRFKHPRSAIYLLGAEDGGIPGRYLNDKKIIQIPTVNTVSFNVAVAGSIVMYDRFIKEGNKIND
jgi:tRNA(Leu) C34 or U34 (ribose-2'-O)-methylase TrmL